MARWLVILAGGRGERFWPLSRAVQPKQFLALVGNQTMLRRTRERVRPLIDDFHTLVVTGRDYVGKVRENLPELLPSHILGEPVGRNTAPSLAWAAAVIHRSDPRAVMLVLPSDHLIQHEAPFRRLVREALWQAEQRGGFYTFGIKPTHPETGYGYIETRETVAPDRGEGPRVLAARRFVEKPPADVAAQMVASGRYFWNSGMFVFPAADFLEAVGRYLPAVRAAADRLAEDPGQAEDIFPALPAISVDHGVMERVQPLYVLPADIGWDDLGTFAALARLLPRNDDQNAARGKAVFIDSQNVTAISDGPVVSFIGVQDLVVVATPDAVLILPPDRAQDVRAVVEQLRLENEHLL
ncbi:Mannose-1-phosphate guanylyltransferase (GDP) [Candidatus Hydrogenisulfobacillus filiaventi]|uniref:Mannose-1-phosphate guanylyltransferase (GDP) n=1 Tax=Candidatus Hydrogenisulfobacillus filiaventi TaxID=2707344 RepID=A0A6F8ZK91_9FIRM|nr:mannose-1-phosphate guanylyltransferase [Bacillota bacterium]CAB1130086.1 Mannose-1-phosphate guanylyltransferase (GDP) [Candidatus Hydrogenisulfobacillus filiaventi]